MKFDENTEPPINVQLAMIIKGLNLKVIRYDQVGWAWPVLFSLYSMTNADILYTRGTTEGSERVAASFNRFALRFSSKLKDEKPLTLAATDGQLNSGIPPRIQLRLTRNELRLKADQFVRGKFYCAGAYTSFQFSKLQLARNGKEEELEFDLTIGIKGAKGDFTSLLASVSGRSSAVLLVTFVVHIILFINLLYR
jgi:hypothetical protein